MTRRPRARPGLALVGVLSIAFVLLPAAGIAYFGAVSYQEDRGLVAAQLDEQYQAASAVSTSVEQAILTTFANLEAIARADDLDADAMARFREGQGLGAFPFVIEKNGQLIYPAAEPLRRPVSERDQLPSRVPGRCPERGFENCIKTIRAARKRIAQLETARRNEVGACLRDETAACTVDPRDLEAARRSYIKLARSDDTGPEALLGLARLAARSGDHEAAAAHYQELGERFGTRLDHDGISYRLLADLGLAHTRADAAAFLRFYRALLEPSYEAPLPLLESTADRVRTILADMALDPAAKSELSELDQRLFHAREQALFAMALEPELDEMVRTAGPDVRGRPSLGAPGRTVLYQARGDRIIGVLVDRAMLEIEAHRVQAMFKALAPGTRAIVERPGDVARRADRTRTLASSGFGPILPHLSLALVQDRDLPDPLDAIIEARGQRHLAITGVLVALLLFGLIATIRSAARERELARLKSDFVSTVSHELKTPLTSIRMFGEMLQQGVAGDDREREARYHDIIVKESQRLGLLIANLLDYSQIERGTRRYNPTPERVADMAREAIDTFERFRDEPTGIRLRVAEGANEAEILVDREVLLQCLLNLLGNARKYGAPPIDVEVVDESDGHEIALSVTDHGPGISASERERIFREFYRAPAAYSAGIEGTGLGLALVKRHVEAQGGRVRVTSETGGGATFSIHFPRC